MQKKWCWVCAIMTVSMIFLSTGIHFARSVVAGEDRKIEIGKAVEGDMEIKAELEKPFSIQMFNKKGEWKIMKPEKGDTHHFDVETSALKKGGGIPYSDVRATFINLRTKERFTKIVPPMFRDNFHYGTNVSLKKDKYEVIIEVGPPMLAREVTFNKWMQTTKVNFQFEVK